MTPTQTVAFVRACRAANPGWTPLDGTAELWHEAALHKVDLGEAQRALMRLLVEHSPWWPNPGDVVKTVAVLDKPFAALEHPSDSGFTTACYTRDCPCTHDGGCVKGWIETPEGTVRPCPTCRWNRQMEPNENREQWMRRLRAQDKAWQDKAGA